MIRRVVLVTAISALLVIDSGITQLSVGAAQGTPQNPAPQAPAQSQPGMAEMMKMHEQMMGRDEDV